MSMAGAKDELVDAVRELDEPEAELLLSFVHYLRAFEGAGAGGTWPREPPDIARPYFEFLLSLYLRDLLSSEEGLQSREALIERFERLSWLALAEPVFARDWARPEEEEAWADL